MRVLIIAQDRPNAEAIRRTLRYVPACRVVGFVHGRAPCGALIAEWHPDVVLLGELPSRTHLRRRVAEARRATSTAKIVLLASSADQDGLAEMLSAGIDAAVVASAGPATVGLLIRAIVAEQVYHPVTSSMPDEVDVSECRYGLTPRELQILRLVAGGLANGQIATRLGVSETTVKFHLSNTYRKLGLANRTAAAHYAHRHALLRVAA